MDFIVCPLHAYSMHRQPPLNRSLMAVSLLRLRETAQLHVRIAASELPMLRNVALALLKLVMTAVVLRVAVVSMTLLKL